MLNSLFYGLLSFQDILLILLLAAVITWIISVAIDFINIVRKDSLEIDYQVKDLDIVLEKCYDLFPKEILQFRGEVFRRGMKVRIVTSQNKIFEGKFLGLNSDDMICLMTKKFIIAHAVTNISVIENIEK